MGKTNESQKARAFWKMKAAKNKREVFYGPERKDNILGKIKTRPELWEEHLGTGQSFEVRGESVSRLTLGSRAVVELAVNAQ